MQYLMPWTWDTVSWTTLSPSTPWPRTIPGPDMADGAREGGNAAGSTRESAPSRGQTGHRQLQLKSCDPEGIV
eukprot:1627633-Rhodomonas_salina.2